jgi:hypothetical protein
MQISSEENADASVFPNPRGEYPCAAAQTVGVSRQKSRSTSVILAAG